MKMDQIEEKRKVVIEQKRKQVIEKMDDVDKRKQLEEELKRQ